jgi:hypothetical protein
MCRRHNHSCPVLHSPPPPPANSFVIGPAVINTHALRGCPSTIFRVFSTPQFLSALFTVYLLHELKVPGYLRKRPGKNRRQLSNPWQAECSEVDGSGYQKRSGHCRALHATAPMCDNLVWLSRTCAHGGQCLLKKSVQNLSFLI